MEGLEITAEGDIEEFLRVIIYNVDSETYHLSKPQLINLGLSKSDATPSTTPNLTIKHNGNFSGC